MAKQKRIRLATLVSKWERAKPYTLNALVIRTAAFLSGVRETPASVISALDRLGLDDNRRLGADVHEVLTYLRSLEQLDRLGLGESADRPARPGIQEFNFRIDSRTSSIVA